VQLAEDEIRLGERYGATFTLVMLDVDRFKSVNDTHGHDAGDLVLQRVAATAQASLRETDVFARWGGEEFMVLLRRSDLAAGRDVAEKLRAALASSPVEPVGVVTASFGVAEHQPGEVFASLCSRADALLYRAKANGRNRVEC
jgi:diguanylate cyclase (GGDEF)-like protein